MKKPVPAYPYFPGGQPKWHWVIETPERKPTPAVKPRLAAPKSGAADERRQLRGLAEILKLRTQSASTPALRAKAKQQLQRVRGRLLELESA